MTRSSAHDGERNAPPIDSIFQADAVNEERLAAVRSYDLLDSEREEAFDRLTELAADLFGVEVACVSFLDTDRTSFEYKTDLGKKEVNLVASWCSAVVQEGGVFVVEDAHEEKRVADTSSGDEGAVRFYAGVPILSPGGLPIGTFSIMDPEPRSLSDEEKGRLRDLGEMAGEALERRQEARAHQQAARRYERLARRFEAVLQDPKVVVGVLSPEGTLLELNDTALRYVKESKEEVLGLPLWETPWWREETKEEVRQWVRRAAAGEYVSFEADLLGPGEVAYSIEGRIRPVTEEDGQAETLIVSARDVTERQLQAKKLRMLSEAVEQTNDAVLITVAEPLEEPGPRIAYVNDAFEKQTGWAKQEILGKTPRVLQGPETDREVIDSVRESLEAGEEWAGETINYGKDGNPYRAEWNLAPVRDEEGVIEYWVSVQRDVTDRKEAERELRSTKNFYEQILEEVPIQLAVFSRQAEFEYINPQSVGDPEMREWLVGRTNEDYCRKRGLDLEFGRRRDQAIRRVAREVQSERFEETMETQRGPRHFLRVHSPVTDLDGEVRYVVAFGFDITDRKEQERRVREAKEEAERASRLKSAFLANMSHEIRTPLTSILGFADAIGEEVEQGRESGEPDLSILGDFSTLIEKSGRRLLQTLEAVLHLSRLEAGEMSLHLGPVEVATETRGAVEDFRVQAQEARLELTCEIPDEPVRARADEGGVRIVLHNLVDNAIKYTKPGGHVWVRTCKEEDSAVVTVEDTGVGMNSKELEELFQPFKQESEGVSREYEGTGLGLALVRRVTEEMEGTVNVQTEKEKGTKVILRLPLANDGGRE